MNNAGYLGTLERTLLHNTCNEVLWFLSYWYRDALTITRTRASGQLRICSTAVILPLLSQFGSCFGKELADMTALSGRTSAAQERSGHLLMDSCCVSFQLRAPVARIGRIPDGRQPAQQTEVVVNNFWTSLHATAALSSRIHRKRRRC